MRQRKISATRAVLMAFLAGWLFTFFFFSNWNKRDIIKDDIVGYYSYLPAVFIYGDVSMKYAAGNPFFEKKVWGTKFNEVGFIQKYNIGMAVMYSPFFFAGHFIAKLGDYPPDGYSLPYQIMICFTGIFYGWLGLFALRKLLLKYFSESISAATLICIGAGTNLNFYVLSDGAMPHAALFFLVTVFVLFTIRFFENASWQNSILLGATGALIVLIRPNHLFIWFIPLFYGCLSPGGFAMQLQFFKTNFRKVMIWPLCLFIAYLPEFAYWHYMTGNWFHYGYGEEKFFWSHPQFMNLLFSYRKGWFVYTPLMIFSLAGIFFIRKHAKELTLSVVVLLLVNIWLLSSWWCWWYGGSFGSRSFVDLYGPLAIGLAAFLHAANSFSFLSKWLLVPAFTFLIFLNNFQSLQYSWGVLHFDGMTKEAYWKVFLQFDKPDDFEKTLELPDYGKALKGEFEYGD